MSRNSAFWDFEGSGCSKQKRIVMIAMRGFFHEKGNVIYRQMTWSPMFGYSI